jgi:mRNA interferase MazF
MKEGDVILAKVPQADGKLKNRPAIFLRQMPPYNDLLVCGVSTQTHHCVKDFDDIISPESEDFRSSGLMAESVIRLGFLAVLPRNKILGSIGSISSRRYKRLLRNLCGHLLMNTPG